MRHAISIALFLVAVSACADDPIAGEMVKLQGEWQAVECYSEGLKRDGADKSVSGLKFVIKGNELTIPHPDGTSPGRRKTLKVDDPALTPKMIDLKHHDGAESGDTTYGIYRLENDRLTICMPYFGNDQKTRPNEFKTSAADGRMLIVLERVKTK